MLRVGLTGGIGSGKSTVARLFHLLNVPIFEADAAGKRLLAEDGPLRYQVMERFGPGIYPDGRMDRAALAQVVFNDPLALAALNALVHPAVRAAFAKWATEQGTPYVVMESAILVDTGGYRDFHRLVVVSAPEQLRISRVMKRDGVGEESVRARMANQVSEAERSAVAHLVIVNDEERLVIPQVLAVHEQLMRWAET